MLTQIRKSVVKVLHDLVFFCPRHVIVEDEFYYPRPKQFLFIDVYYDVLPTKSRASLG